MLKVAFHVRVTVKHLERRQFFFPLPIHIGSTVFGTRFRTELGQIAFLHDPPRRDPRVQLSAPGGCESHSGPIL